MCTHHWVLNQTNFGTCKNCGSDRQFVPPEYWEQGSQANSKGRDEDNARLAQAFQIIKAW